MALNWSVNFVRPISFLQNLTCLMFIFFLNYSSDNGYPCGMYVRVVHASTHPHRGQTLTLVSYLIFDRVSH